MKVFISWSGNTSKRIGEVFRNWLPLVLQTVRPYYTPSDIDKGTRWSGDIAGELETSQAGIFCVTKENIVSQWLMFEAGAISKQVGNSLVCPILLDLDTAELYGPLTQFQTTLFNKTDVRKLIVNLNKANTDHILNDAVVSQVFEQFWPELEQKVNDILKDGQHEQSNRPVQRDDRELLEEILDLTRALTIQKSGGFKAHNELNDLISNFLTCFYSVFDEDWEHSKASLVDSQYYIDENGTFINPRVDDEANNWANRGALLASYRALVAYIEHNKINIRTKY
jgi:hypothetical protein